MTPENFEDSNWKCIGEAPVEAKPPYLPPVVTPVRLTAHIEGEKCVAVTTEPGVPAWSTGDVAEACGGKGKPFSQRTGKPGNPYEPNIGHAAVFAAMTEQNAAYTARRTKELAKAKRTLFAQEAPLFRNAPLIKGRDW